MKFSAFKEISFDAILDGLAKIGEFLTGVAAVLAVIFGRNALKEYWLKRESEAAVFALSKFRVCIEEILHIANQRQGYQYLNFEDEIASKEKVEPHIERPARLVSKKIRQLRKDLHDSLAKISGDPAIKLFTLIDSLQKYCTSLGSAMYADLGGTTKEILQSQYIQSTLHSYSDKLDSILKEAENILIPIIESVKK